MSVRHLSRIILNQLEEYVFERNVYITRRHIEFVIGLIIENIKYGFINSYSVTCNETNNTPDIIDQNKLVVDVKIETRDSQQMYSFRYTLCGNHIVQKEIKKTKQIFNDIDPYGEEEWDDE